MSGSVLHKNHNPLLLLLPFVFYSWNMVFFKLQIDEIYNLKQFQKISVVSPRTEYDR